MSYPVFLTMLIGVFTVGLPARGQTQFPRNDKGRIEFVKIVQLDSASKAGHFAKARLWVANTFRSAQDVIQYESVEEGKILCKGVFEINPTGAGMSGTIHRDQAGYVRFTMEIAIKENRCRIRAYELTHEAVYAGGSLENLKPACGGLVMTVKTWNSIQLQTIDKMNAAFAEFERAMNAKDKDDF